MDYSKIANKYNFFYLYLILFGFIVNTNTTAYFFSKGPIDVVIPVHEKDLPTLNMVIEGARNNIEGVRRIITVSSKKFTEKAEWFNETDFPFNKELIALEIFGNEKKAFEFLKSKKTRIGWIFQQFIKLYAPIIIPEISENVLIVDADTIFLKPVSFQDTHENPLFNVGTEYHEPYFHHGSRLLPNFKKVFSQHSGVSHHMIFNREVILDLFGAIVNNHKIDPWKAICRCIDQKEVFGSCMSEYEIYFNFIFSRTNQAKIRKLKWANIHLKDCHKYLDYDYVSCHSYLKE
ncbi:MAG: DUF6492 family protein [Candidatus Babeliales bacterium]